MKLNIKNFTGTLQSGELYRIVFKDEYDEIFKKRYIYLIREFLNADFDSWFTREVIAKSYDDIKNYKEALRNLLTEAELQWKIQLLKAELKVAA
ncbi:MAG: hypothetical protein KGZ87_05570 [Bacteroidetes bacterium]|nr:hypothetical protein [Bacteroidota bacterium]